jgi:hypothetical protein
LIVEDSKEAKAIMGKEINKLSRELCIIVEFEVQRVSHCEAQG